VQADAALVQMPEVRHRGLPVASRDALRALGLSNYRLRTAVASGRWQEALPDVFVAHSGPLTRRERWSAALCYAGPGSVLSHRSALAAWGARVEEARPAVRVAGVRGRYAAPEEGGLVEITVPHGRHVRSRAFVVVHQSRRPVAEGYAVDRLPLAPPARAAVDVAGTSTRRGDVDHVIADVLQRRLATVPELEEQAALLGRRLTPWLCQALADARRGMRSVGESELRRAISSARVPEPEWGASIDTRDGTYFVDAYWRAPRVAVEADGSAFHLSAEDWARDLRRQNAIQEAQVTLFRYPVRRLRADPLGCGLEILRLVA
jgi:very-short-patch-repair endonuclease